VISIFQGLLTPLIALIAVGIAFAQWWTSRNRLKLDLFDRRWTIYEATRTMLAEIFAQARSSRESQRAYLQGIREAEWLFDETVAHYLTKEFWKRIVELDAANSMIEPTTQGSERQGAINKKWEIMQWMTEQDPIVDAMFGRFLQMDQSFIGWLQSRRRLRAHSKKAEPNLAGSEGA